MSVICLNKEAHFDLAEMFVSGTDKRGIITSANEVLVRIAGFPRQELIGSPHNIIRHPDMPKSVFRLFWEYLKDHKPICAYVKNRSIHGEYYWVLAYAFPTKKGYLSIRLKPSSPLLGKVEALYKQILQAETSGGMDAGEKVLKEGLQTLGFASYDEFMRLALQTEIDSRAEGLKARDAAEGNQEHTTDHELSESLVAHLMGITNTSNQELKKALGLLTQESKLKEFLNEKSKEVSRACRVLEDLSLNMAVGANKLGRSGVSLAVVSTSFQKLSKELYSKFSSLESSIASLAQKLDDNRFDLNTLRLQSEMLEFSLSEMLQNQRIAGSIDRPQEKAFASDLADLLDLLKERLAVVVVLVTTTAHDLGAQLRKCQSLRRSLMALDLVRLGGLLESARTHATDQSFTAFVNEMAETFEKINEPLALVETRLGEICFSYKDLARLGRELSQNYVAMDMARFSSSQERKTA